MFEIRVYGIILDDEGKVMLCHSKDRDLWVLPGGGMEKGEAPWQTVVREVKEETGLDIEVERLAGVYSKIDRDQVMFVFVCRSIGGEIKFSPDDEVDKISYFHHQGLPENMLPVQAERLRNFFADKDRLQLKIQRGK